MDSNQPLNPTQINESREARVRYLQALGESRPGVYSAAQHTNFKLTGVPGATSIFETFIERPDLPTQDEAYNPKFFVPDMYRNAPSKTISFSGKPLKGLQRLKASSASTAAQLLAPGASPMGYFVMTDQQLAAFYDTGMTNAHSPAEAKVLGKMMTSRGVRGALYSIAVKPRDNGYVDVAINPLGIRDHQVRESGRFYASLRGDAAWQMLSAFRPVSSRELKFSRAQYRILEHERVVGALDALKNYDTFKHLVDDGVVPPLGGKGALNQHLAKSSRKLADRALQPLWSNNLAAHNMLSAFDAAVETAFEEFSRGRNIQSGTKAYRGLDSKEFAAFRNRMFQRFTAPVIDGMKRNVSMPIRVGRGVVGMKVLSGAALMRQGGLLGALQQRWSKLQPQFSEMGRLSLGSNYYDMPESDTNYIRNRLMLMDEAEAALQSPEQQVIFNGQRQVSHRAANFNRLVERMDQYVLGNLSTADAAGKSNRKRFDVNYTFEESDKGTGIRVSFVPKQAGEIHAGDTGVDGITPGQAFIPIEDLEGKITTDSGAQYAVRGLAVSDVVMERAEIARWDPDLQLVSQGLSQHKYQVVHAGPEGSGVQLFPFGDVVQAAIDTRLGEVKRALASGSGAAAASAIERAIQNTALGDLKLGDHISSHYRTQVASKFRRSVSMLEQFLHDPFDWAGIDTRRIDAQAGKESYRHKLRQLFVDEDYVGVFGKNPKEKTKRIIEQIKKLRKGLFDMRFLHGDDKEQLELQLNNLIGGQAGYVTNQRTRERIEYGALVGAPYGDKAANDGAQVSEDVYWHSWPGGYPEERPHQFFKNLELNDTDSVLAKTPLTWEEGYEHWQADPKQQRNLRVGFMLGAQQLDENGNVIGGIVDADSFMSRFGNWEQQALINEEGRLAFGDANLENAKAIAGTSKWTLQYARTAHWSDPAVQVFAGVDGPKTVSKHNSLGANFLLGWLNRINADAVDKKTTAEIIREKLGPMASSVEVANGLIQVKLKQNLHGPAELPGINQLEEIAKAAGVDLIKDIDVTAPDGTRWRVNTAVTVLPTRIIANSSPTTTWDARQALYPTRNENGEFMRPPLNPDARQINLSAMDLLREAAEGNEVNYKLVNLASFNAKRKSGVYYALGQMSAAYYFNFGEGPERHRLATKMAKNKAIKKTSFEKLVEAGRGKPRASHVFDSLEEFEQLYGRNSRLVTDMPTIGHFRPNGDGRVLVPDQLPRMEHGVIAPTKTQVAFDRVMAAAQGSDENAYRDAYQRFKATMHDELFKGDGALTREALRNVPLKGVGITRGLLTQNMWGEYDPVTNPHGMRPYELRVGLEQAEIMGLIDPIDVRNGKTPWGIRAKKGSELAQIREQILASGDLADPGNLPHLFVTAHRQPQATVGRMQMRLTIDPSITGTGIYHQKAASTILYADSDGDVLGLKISGLVGGVQADKDLFTESQAAAEKIWNQKAIAWAERLVPSGAETTQKLLGMDYIKSLLKERKDQGFTWRRRDDDEKAAMVWARRNEAAMGVIGGITDPLSTHFRMMRMAARTDQDRHYWGLLEDATAILREEGLKSVKDKTPMDLNALAASIKDEDIRPIVDTGTEGEVRDWTKESQETPFLDRGEGIQVGDIARENIVPGTSPEARQVWNDLINENFIEPNSKNPNDTKKYAKALKLSLLNDWVADQRDPATRDLPLTERQQQKGTTWFEALSKKQRGELWTAAKGRGSKYAAKSYDRYLDMVLGGNLEDFGPHEQVATELRHLLASTKFEEEHPITLEEMAVMKSPPVVEPALETPAIMPVPEPVSVPEPAAVIPEPAATMTESIHLAESDAAKLVEPQLATETLQKVAAETAHDTISKTGSKNPWAMAALGAGAVLGIAGLGVASRGAPAMPDIASDGPQPRVRVLDDKFGGSAESYNVRVRARADKDVNEDDLGRVGSGSLGSGTMTVHHVDHRKSISDQNRQDFADQMKGR